METNNDLQSLKSNPIFQLSLASKELFHSNFLYWLSQDEKLKDLFKKIIGDLCGNNSIWDELKDDYVVLREFKNFDLCICKKKSTQTNNGSSAEGKVEGEGNSTDENPTEDSDPFYDDIQQAGEIVFVLENKFKSIATAGQLRKYVEKTLEYNVPILRNRVVSKKGKSRWHYSYSKCLRQMINQSNTKFVLLTLAEDFAEIEAIGIIEKDTFGCNQNGKKINVDPNKTEGNKFCSTGNKWIIKTYRSYADILDKSLKNNDKLKTDSLPYQIIDNYQQFIRLFSETINDRLGKINLEKNINWNSIFEGKNNNDYKLIRCSDIWQKMAMHKIAQELMGKDEIQKLIKKGFEIDTDSSDKHCRECSDKDNFDKTIFIGVQYFHSLALLEIKYRIDNNCMFVIQQQGNSLCAGIDILQNRNNYLKKSRKDNNWSDIVDDRLFQGFNLIYILDNSGNIWINDNNTYEVKVLKDTIKRISNKSNGEIPAYENEKGGFYYKNIILNPSDKSKNNGDSTINDTLDYMVECLKRAIIIYPPQN